MPRFVTEAATFEQLHSKIVAFIPELIEANSHLAGLPAKNVSMELLIQQKQPSN